MPTAAYPSRRLATAALTLAMTAALTLPTAAQPQTTTRPDDAMVPAPTEVETAASTVRLAPLGTHETGTFDESAAEIVAFDAGTDRLFVVNAQSGAIDVLDVTDPTEPTLVETVSMAGQTLSDGTVVPEGAEVNSVAVHDGVVAVATQAPQKTDPGWVVFLTADGEGLGGVHIGSLPDMTAFSPDGQHVVVANEGEPAEDFSSDPEGSVAVIDVSGLPEVTQDDVRLARFTAWDEDRELPDGVRVFGPDVPVPDGQEPAGRVARNLEPEYVTVSADSTTAWASLQEANAIATIDLESAEVTEILPVPTTDHSQQGFALDPSDRDDATDIDTWPVTGLPQPDAIGAYTADGSDYLVTANEGDAREWGDYEEGVRVGDETYELCADAFGGEEAVAELKREENLGRLNATTASGQRGDGCYEEIVAFGSRSFSILDAEGNRIFDSGQTIESEIARLIEDGVLPEHAFNANHSANPSFDARSDDKGPEPEGLALGEVGDRTYLFLGLERVGGVMVFDITAPAEASYVTYLNTRNWDAEYEDELPEGVDPGDLGPEGLDFISAEDSPTGVPLLAVGYEVSGTTTMFEVQTVAPERLAGANRYETAVDIASELDPGIERVYLASGQDFPDALSGAALAGSTDSAVLLTREDNLPGATATELNRLAPGEIVVLGGDGAVSDDVVAAARQIAPVRRIEGRDRYATSAQVAAEVGGESDVVYVASGQDYPDALTGAARAGAEGAPVLLTRKDHLPAAAVNALVELEPGRIVVLGGTGAVSGDVAEALSELAPVERIAGDDRYHTAALVAGDTGEVPVSYLATGQDYPDALTAAALAARTGSPLLLTRDGRVPAPTDLALREQRPLRLVLLGGETVVGIDAAREAAVRIR